MTTSRFMQRSRWAALAAVSAVLVSGCEFTPYSLPLPGGADLGDQPYTVKAEFRDAMDLVPQGGVRSSDVTVGRITSVELKPGSWVALVTMEVNGNAKLPDNAIATIRQTSLLGEKFVSLDPPAEGAFGELGDGDVIPLDRSGRNPELEEVLTAAALLFNGGGLDKVNTITRELNDLMDGRESDIRDLIQNATTFTQTLDTNKNAIIGALERIDRLALSVSAQEDEIDEALRDIPPGLEVIDDQRDDLIEMLDSLENLSDVATDVIRRSREDTLTDLRLLEPVLKGLADAGDSLVGSLRGLITFPFSDGWFGDSVAVAEAACPENTVEVVRAGACFGDYINLDINLTLNPEQATQLLAGLLSIGGYTPPVSGASAPATANAAAEPANGDAPSAAEAPNPAEDVTDAVGGLTDTVTGLLGGRKPSAEEEPEEERSGGLLGFLGLNRAPAVSVGTAQQTDVGKLLVGPVVAE